MQSRQLLNLLKTLPKFVTVTTLSAFLVLIFLGLFDCANPIMQSRMTMDMSHGQVGDCVPGENCGMNIGEHIAIWQGMITANLNQNSAPLFVSLILAAAFVFLFHRLFSSPQISSLLTRFIYYDRDHREIKLYNYFIHIFSNGILQPKLFA